MFTIKFDISEDEHDRFVREHPLGKLLQSSKWAHIKDNWENERIGFYRNEEIVASASILIKSLPLGYTMFYIPSAWLYDVLYPEGTCYGLSRQRVAFFCNEKFEAVRTSEASCFY